MNLYQKYALKIAELDKEHNIGLLPSELKKVVTSCVRQKIEHETNDEWVAVVESLVADLRSDPLKQEIKKCVLAVSQLCPVCGKQAEPITLMKDRLAYYCRVHRAVTPAIVNE